MNKEIPSAAGRCTATNKIQWRHRAAARKSARVMTAQGRTLPGRPFNIFRCDQCGYYHIGKKRLWVPPLEWVA